MKLFVWFNTEYAQAYGGDCVFVLAPDLETARSFAQRPLNWSFGMPSNDRMELAPTRSSDSVVNREPDLIIDSPEAVYYAYFS